MSSGQAPPPAPPHAQPEPPPLAPPQPPTSPQALLRLRPRPQTRPRPQLQNALAVFLPWGFGLGISPQGLWEVRHHCPRTGLCGEDHRGHLLALEGCEWAPQTATLQARWPLVRSMSTRLPHQTKPGALVCRYTVRFDAYKNRLFLLF